MSDTGQTCGFIGLGSQGAPMARRMIDAGLRVILWARRPESLDPYRGTSAEFAASVAELGAQVDHVGLCVVTDTDVEQVCAQLLPAMRKGSRIAIHSTIHPDTCKRLASDAAARGIILIDAPVSGGAPGAEAGTMTVMVGGDPEAAKAAEPIFRTFARLIVHLGDVGAGQECKLINNTLMAANLALAHNALAAGEQLGMSRTGLAEILQASSGQSFAVGVAARMANPESFAHGASLLAKDVRLLGEVLGSDSPQFTPLREAADPFLKSALGN